METKQTDEASVKDELKREVAKRYRERRDSFDPSDYGLSRQIEELIDVLVEKMLTQVKAAHESCVVAAKAPEWVPDLTTQTDTANASAGCDEGWLWKAARCREMGVSPMDADNWRQVTLEWEALPEKPYPFRGSFVLSST